MGAIQSSINSMIGSASHAIMAVKGYQELKAKKAEKAAKVNQPSQSAQAQASQVAKKNSANEVVAKKTQKRNFMEYLKKEPTSLGGTVGQLSPAVQKQLAKQYNPYQRKTLMDRVDKEAKNGINK